MAKSIKVTETFTITAKNGDSYSVQEHTRFESGRVGAVTHQVPGRSFLKTVDGRGVLKQVDGTFAIPSLGVVATRLSTNK